MDTPPILEIGNVLVSLDCLTERFCCDLNACKGQCCVEGDAGAPVTLDEVGDIEESLDAAWSSLSAPAQAVIDRHGVAYTDTEGELVTSIVGGKDCVFTYHDKGCCFCALEKAFRDGKNRFCKPISCYLYPIREVKIGKDTVGLNYHVWDICKEARLKGRELDLPVYQFLKDPLIKRFGQEWYQELEKVVEELKKGGYIK